MGDTSGGMGSVSGIGGPTGNALIDRMIRAARLDSNLYEEVEADRDATGQAAIVVVITAVAAAIGSALGAVTGGDSAGVVGGIVSSIFFSLFYWVVWSYLTYFIGTRFFGGTASPGELLRTLGFATTPRILNVLTFVPGVGFLIGIAVSIWSLVAGVIAVRQALDFDTTKAVLTALIAWVITMLPIVVLGGIVAAFFIGAAAAS